jgi:hypothetical protein
MNVTNKRRLIAYGCVLGFVLWIILCVKYPVSFLISGAIFLLVVVITMVEVVVRDDRYDIR